MSVISHPLSTEKSIRMMETENTLAFIVARTSRKKQIKEEIEKMFKAKVLKINTIILPSGKKKAYVKISPETPAIDIATQLGMV